jgi:hypothetical protein
VSHDTEPEIHLPAPTVWPFVVGAGVALVGFGVLTGLLFAAVGLVLFAWGLVGWIGDLRHEP